MRIPREGDIFGLKPGGLCASAGPIGLNLVYGDVLSRSPPHTPIVSRSLCYLYSIVRDTRSSKTSGEKDIGFPKAGSKFAVREGN